MPSFFCSFVLSSEEIAAVLASPDIDPEPPIDVPTPERLVTDEQLASLMAVTQPRYIPLVEGGSEAFPPMHPSGVVQRKLSNGIAVNYRYGGEGPRGGC